MDLIKHKIIKLLLHLNIAIGKKLTFWQAKYEADDYAVKNENFDLRSISDRIKNVLIYDQSVIDRRFAECQGCEHFIKDSSRCKKCGCFMKVKTRIATARCPVGKWEKEYEFIKGKAVGSHVIV